MTHASRSLAAPARTESYPENPVLTRVWRGAQIESQHRGAWVVCDSGGRVIDGAGEWKHPIFARSATKSMQGLPLLETGAAERFGFEDADVALALASHDAERCHVERVAATLARLSLGEGDLGCGPHEPYSAAARDELVRNGLKPSRLHNNCSGKHAGFLALAKHLSDAPARYLDVASACQRRVRAAVEEVTGVGADEITVAIDGCSAPTYRMPLFRLATGMARMANPSGFEPARRAAAERMLRAAAARPELVAGTRGRLCTDILRATGGRLFPKVGAEAVYLVGVAGADRGIAVKIDDGNQRGMHALVVELLARFGFIDASELHALQVWRAGPFANYAGVDVGRVEVVA